MMQKILFIIKRRYTLNIRRKPFLEFINVDGHLMTIAHEPKE